MVDRRARGTQRKQSWRQSSSTSKSVGLSRRTKASLWTAVGILLLIAFVWWQWPTKAAQTYLYVLTAGDTANLSTPMIPWHSEPLDSSEVVSLRNLHVPKSRPVESTSQSFLSGISASGKDRLVVYVCGHVLPSSDHESAELLCRDFDLSSNTAAMRIPVRTILEKMIATKAQVKLLVIDSGRLNSDPRLGMLANDATELIEKELREMSAPDLWVLTSNDSMEPGTGWFGNGRTTFGESFVLGMAGQADSSVTIGDKNFRVTLGELYRFVKTRCWRLTRGIQTPRLLNAAADFDAEGPSGEIELLTLAYDPGKPDSGEDVADDELPPTDETELAPANAPPANAPPANAATTDSPARDSENKSSQGADEETETDQDNSADAKPVVAEDGAETKPAPAATAPSDSEATLLNAAATLFSDNPRVGLLNEGWKLRDNLQPPINHDAWSPCDYAPHLWRELNLQLLDYEYRLVGDNSTRSDAIQQELEKIVAGLRALLNNVRNPGTGSTTSGINNQTGDWLPSKLLEAASWARSAPERSTFASNSESMSRISLSHRKIQRDSFFIPYYVRWLADANLVASAEDTEFDALASEVMQAIQRSHEYFERVTTMSSRRLNPIDVPEVEQIQKEALDAAGNLRDGWTKYVSDLRQSAENARVRCLIEVTLGSPLLTAESRAELRAALRDSEPGEFHHEQTDVRLRNQPVLYKWDRLAQQCRVEAELLSMAAVAFDYEAVSRDAAKLRAATDRAVKLHNIGQRFRTAYKSLSDSYRSDKSPLALNLIDARDARRIRLDDVAHPRFELLGPTELVLVNAPPETLDLELAGNQLSWDIECTNPSHSDMTVRLDFDERRVRVTTPAGDSVKDDTPINYKLVEGRQTLRFHIRPIEKSFLPLAQYKLELSVSGGDAAKVRSQLVLRRPPPNVVDLVVYHRASPQKSTQRSLGRNGILLQPFSNRSSTFDLALRNLSGVSRQVNVRIVKVPPMSRIANGRLLDSSFEPLPRLQRRVLKSDAKLRSQLETLAMTAQPVDLPATRDEIPITLAKSTGRPGANPETTPAQPAAAAPRVADISFGMICEITDVAQPENQWLKWLEISPLSPAEFLRCERGEAAVDEFAIDVRSDRPRAALPDLVSFQDQPMIVEWNSTSLPPSLTRKNLIGQIAAPGESARVLVAHNGQQNFLFRVQLDIDKYPRAFSYETSFSRASNLEPVEQVNVSVHMGRANQRNIPFSGSSHPPSSIVLPVPTEKDKPEIGLQIDPPVNAFGRDNSEDYVAVSWENATQVLSAYSKRDVSTKLVSLEDGMTVLAKVSDFRKELDLRGKSGELFLSVQAQIQGVERSLARIPVVIDGQRPVARVFLDSDVVYIGRVVRVELDATDNTGLAKGAAGIVEADSDPIGKKRFVFDAQNQLQIQRKIRLATKGLQAGDYYVKFEVADQVGNLHSSHAKFTLQEPPKPTNEKVAPPLKFTFQGRVRVGSSTYPDRITVVLEGSNAEPQRTQDGWFKFSNIDPGAYIIKADGTVKSGEFAAELPIKLLTAGDPQKRPVIVQLKAAK